MSDHSRIVNAAIVLARGGWSDEMRDEWTEMMDALDTLTRGETVTTATAYHRIAQHQDVIGSWVVFDPTGRDLRSCLVVGRIEAVTWDDADDGTEDGFPRTLLTVVENGTEERWSVTCVEAVLRR